MRANGHNKAVALRRSRSKQASCDLVHGFHGLFCYNIRMELFDTHAHFEGTAEEIQAQLARARDAGVTRVLAVGGNAALNRGVALTGSPYQAIGWDRDQAGQALPALDYTDCCALGEIGLDYHYSPETRAVQMTLMAEELERARQLNLPVIIHTREADDDTLGLLREIPSRGIIHCFTGSPAFCRQLLDLGFYISISGIVTFRLAENVRESARVVPNDRLLIETDSPYLAPIPLRGKPNEPAYLVHTARFLADLRTMSLVDFADLTTQNALTLLGNLV